MPEILKLEKNKKTGEFKVPDYVNISILNSLKKGEILLTKEGFQIRRVIGGFIFEYEKGSNVFISTDEFGTD